MAWWVHTQNAGIDWAVITLLGWQVPVLIRRKCRIVTQNACHISIAENVPVAPFRIIIDGLRLAHLAIRAIRSIELFSIGLCLHRSVLSSFFSFWGRLKFCFPINLYVS